MEKPIKISSKDAVTRGEGSSYTIDNYITKNVSEKLSMAVSHLRGEIWKTKNTISDRIYYLLEGKGVFSFDSEEIEAEKGDVIYIPQNTSYRMKGDFDAVLINSPAFDINFEKNE